MFERNEIFGSGPKKTVTWGYIEKEARKITNPEEKAAYVLAMQEYMAMNERMNREFNEARAVREAEEAAAHAEVQRAREELLEARRSSEASAADTKFIEKTLAEDYIPSMHSSTESNISEAIDVDFWEGLDPDEYMQKQIEIPYSAFKELRTEDVEDEFAWDYSDLDKEVDMALVPSPHLREEEFPQSASRDEEEWEENALRQAVMDPVSSPSTDDFVDAQEYPDNLLTDEEAWNQFTAERGVSMPYNEDISNERRRRVDAGAEESARQMQVIADATGSNRVAVDAWQNYNMRKEIGTPYNGTFSQFLQERVGNITDERAERMNESLIKSDAGVDLMQMGQDRNGVDIVSNMNEMLGAYVPRSSAPPSPVAPPSSPMPREGAMGTFYGNYNPPDEQFGIDLDMDPIDDYVILQPPGVEDPSDFPLNPNPLPPRDPRETSVKGYMEDVPPGRHRQLIPSPPGSSMGTPPYSREQSTQSQRHFTNMWPDGPPDPMQMGMEIAEYYRNRDKPENIFAREQIRSLLQPYEKVKGPTLSRKDHQAMTGDQASLDIVRKVLPRTDKDLAILKEKDKIYQKNKQELLELYAKTTDPKERIAILELIKKL